MFRKYKVHVERDVVDQDGFGGVPHLIRSLPDQAALAVVVVGAAVVKVAAAKPIVARWLAGVGPPGGVDDRAIIGGTEEYQCRTLGVRGDRGGEADVLIHHAQLADVLGSLFATVVTIRPNRIEDVVGIRKEFVVVIAGRAYRLPSVV